MIKSGVPGAGPLQGGQRQRRVRVLFGAALRVAPFVLLTGCVVAASGIGALAPSPVPRPHPTPVSTPRIAPTEVPTGVPVAPATTTTTTTATTPDQPAVSPVDIEYLRGLENPDDATAMRHRLAAEDFPALPPDSGEGRRIVYSNSQQQVWLVEADGSIFTSHPVSGRRGVPKPGSYQVYSKSIKAWAAHDGITMNHMVRFARGRVLAIGFHSIPVYPGGRPLQTLDELGSYRSSGCVRQAPGDALALYAWAEIGTVVVVLP